MELFTNTAMADLKINAVQARTSHLLHTLQLYTKQMIGAYRRQQNDQVFQHSNSSDAQHCDAISSIDIIEGEFTARRSVFTTPWVAEINDKNPKSRSFSMRHIVRQTLVKGSSKDVNAWYSLLQSLQIIYIGQTQSRRSVEKFGEYRLEAIDNVGWRWICKVHYGTTSEETNS